MTKTKLILLSLAFSTAAFAHAGPADIPECASIAKSCEAAGYMPGEHKKDGKGLWVDCVHAIAKGKSVTGVSATADEAKACLAAHKAKKHK